MFIVYTLSLGPLFCLSHSRAEQRLFFGICVKRPGAFKFYCAASVFDTEVFVPVPAKYCSKKKGPMPVRYRPRNDTKLFANNLASDTLHNFQYLVL